MKKLTNRQLGVIFAILISIVGYGLKNVNIPLPTFVTSAPVIVKSQSVNTLINSIEINEAGNYDYSRASYDEPSKTFSGETARIYTLQNSKWNKTINIANFEYQDPYTNNILNSESDIEYDHIIPLSYVNQHGGASWSAIEKNTYCYDLANGVDVSRTENRIKSDKGPSEYLPKANQAEYCYSWLVIANRYHISISAEDMRIIKTMLKDKASLSTIN